jgi:hypothetical protein
MTSDEGYFQVYGDTRAVDVVLLDEDSDASWRWATGVGCSGVGVRGRTLLERAASDEQLSLLAEGTQ